MSTPNIAEQPQIEPQQPQIEPQQPQIEPQIEPQPEIQPEPQPERPEIPLDRRTIYAKLANAAYDYYENPNMTEVIGYKIVSTYSDRNAVLFMDPIKKELVYSIRGTKPTNFYDIRADTYILLNQLKQNDRFKVLLRRAKIIAEGKGPYKLILTGHSLGGALAIEIAESIISKVDAIYAYNPGFSPGAAIESVGKQLAGKLGIKSKAIRIEKELKKKLTIYQSGFDPISILSHATGETKLVKSKSWNTHGMKNFTGGTWWMDIIHEMSDLNQLEDSNQLED